MESGMGGIVCRGNRGNIVKTCGAKASYSAVGHGLAACNSGFIFEVEESVWLGWSIEGLRVPGCRQQTLSACGDDV